jgi:deoxyribose-phosphate aldolase
MDELYDDISREKAEIESLLDISIPLWFETPEGKPYETMPESKIASQLPGMIDHTLLRPDAGIDEIEQLCDDAKKYGFCSVCVYGPFIERCRALLDGSDIKICSVVGFPSGAFLSDVKAYEAGEAVRMGADEIDMVINIAALKDKDLSLVFDDIGVVVKAVPERVIIKVIIETGFLTCEEKIRACILAKAAGADYVKTSTGFGPSGANADDVRLMRTVVGSDMGVKAAGGIRDASGAISMVKAGADRIGTSASINIITGLLRKFGPNCIRRGN